MERERDKKIREGRKRKRNCEWEKCTPLLNLHFDDQTMQRWERQKNVDWSVDFLFSSVHLKIIFAIRRKKVCLMKLIQQLWLDGKAESDINDSRQVHALVSDCNVIIWADVLHHCEVKFIFLMLRQILLTFYIGNCLRNLKF